MSKDSIATVEQRRTAVVKATVTFADLATAERSEQETTLYALLA